MNLPKLLLRRALVAVALCAGLFLIPAGRAQTAPPAGGTRFLFIFNTSADMKKRLPAVQSEVNQLLSTSLGGRLQRGDSVGVWTFDQDLHTGQFPLQSWNPEDAVTIASGINKFVGKQHYANRTRFDALQPQLNEVIQNSAQLTVLIFCDGGDAIQWTPYAADLNRVFQQRVAEQKKAAQPFVLVLRTQLGQYTGCSLNFPPGMVNVPDFPPLPAPPPPPAPPAPPPAPTPAVVVKPPPGPPLVIIGTKVETNWPSGSASFPLTNTGPSATAMAVSAVPTNPVVPQNPAASPLPEPPALATSTNIEAAPSGNPVAPPLPANPTPVAQTNTAPAPPAISLAPTSSPASRTAVTSMPPTNPAPVIQTNAALPPATDSTREKLVSLPPSSSATSATPTNAIAPTPESSGANHKGAIAIGVALLMGAVVLAALAVFRLRRPSRGSLITRSMRKD
jgi:hypothetical protein